MAKMTEEQKAAIAGAVIEALETGNDQALGKVVAAGVVANNPKYAAWGPLLAAAVGATLARFHADYGADASGQKAPWYKRILPW